MLISVVICTYNRSHLLKLCLDSLHQQTIDSSQFEVIIVDNNSSDDTKNVALEYSKLFNHFNYIFEPQTGLSFARNTGFKNAQTEWILYLDDDAKAFPNLVERTVDTSNKYHFQCFGGIVISYFNEKDIIPRWWVIDEFETNLFLLKKYQGMCALETETPWGGVFIIKKELLTELKGFDTTLGMSGKKIGYGEEYDLVARIRQNGFPVGIDTEIKIHHLVASQKLTFSWYIKAEFAKGKHSPYLPYNFLYTNKSQLIKYIILIPWRYFRTIGYVVKCTIKKNSYHVENVLLCFLCLTAYNCGFALSLINIIKEKLIQKLKLL